MMMMIIIIIIIIITTTTTEDRPCLLVGVATPSDRNVIQKGAQKKLKYKIRSIEIQRMWNMKCFVIAVVTDATGIVSKRLKISGKNSTTTFNRFFVKNCHTRNITHHKESATS
jgi:hypothetical protein